MTDQTPNQPTATGSAPSTRTLTVRPKIGESDEACISRLQSQHPGVTLVVARGSNPGPKAGKGTRKAPPIPGDVLEPQPGKYPVLLDLSSVKKETESTLFHLPLGDDYLDGPIDYLSEFIPDQLPRLNLRDEADVTALFRDAKKINAYATAAKILKCSDEAVRLEMRNFGSLFSSFKPDIITSAFGIIDRLGNFETPDHWFKLADTALHVRRLLSYASSEGSPPADWNDQFFTWLDLKPVIDRHHPLTWLHEQTYRLKGTTTEVAFPAIDVNFDTATLANVLEEVDRTRLDADLDAVRWLLALTRFPREAPDRIRTRDALLRIGIPASLPGVSDAEIRDSLELRLSRFKVVQEVLSRQFNMSNLSALSDTGTASQLVQIDQHPRLSLGVTPVNVSGADMAFGFAFNFEPEIEPLSLEQWEFTHGAAVNVARAMYLQSSLK